MTEIWEGIWKDQCNTYYKQQWGKQMKTNLRTFSLCVKIQGCEEPGSYFQIFVGIYWTGLETRRQIAKKEMRLKRKKEKRKNKNKLQRR